MRQSRTPPWGKGYYGDLEQQDPAHAAGWQGGPDGKWQDGSGSSHGRPAGESYKRLLAGAPTRTEQGNPRDARPPWGHGYYGDLELADPADAAGWQAGPRGGWQSGTGSSHGHPATDDHKRDLAAAPAPAEAKSLRRAS